MRRLLLLTLGLPVLVLSACPADNIVPIHINSRGENCGENRPPLIRYVELNSFIPEGSIDYAMSVHFDWLDPGESEATQAPNFEGGLFSMEFGGRLSEDIEITEGLLVAACSPTPTEEEPNPCAAAGYSLGGCAPGQIDTCVAGELTFLWVAVTPLQSGEFVDLEFRAHDRCQGTSNEKSATYEIGSGLAVEGGGDDGA